MVYRSFKLSLLSFPLLESASICSQWKDALQSLILIYFYIELYVRASRLLYSAFSICTYANEQNVFSLFYKAFFLWKKCDKFSWGRSAKIGLFGYRVRKKNTKTKKNKIKLEVSLKEATNTTRAKNWCGWWCKPCRK